MKREDFSGANGQKIALTVVFGNSVPLFYTGYIISVSEGALIFRDRFIGETTISFDSIKNWRAVE